MDGLTEALKAAGVANPELVAADRDAVLRVLLEAEEERLWALRNAMVPESSEWRSVSAARTAAFGLLVYLRSTEAPRV